MRRLAIFQVILAAIVLTALHPRTNHEWFACLVILVAGESVVYRDLRTLYRPGAWEKRQRAPGSAQAQAHQSWEFPARPSARTESPHTASDQSESYIRVERRADGLELRPGDSVEQIARTMVASSFRQASMKYHPDHGGSNELMGRIVQARAMLLRSLPRP